MRIVTVAKCEPLGGAFEAGISYDKMIAAVGTAVAGSSGQNFQNIAANPWFGCKGNNRRGRLQR